MSYFCPACKKVEAVWNSRDGAAARAIPCADCGGRMEFQEWPRPARFPAFVPERGSRLFIDIPPELAPVIERWRAQRAITGESKVENLEAFSQIAPGEPWLITWP